MTVYTQKASIPEELSGIWTTELTAAWNKLDEKQQSFVREWYTNGFNGRKAYMHAYKTNNEDSANSAASRLLASDNVYVIRKAIQATLKPPIEQIHQVYIDAMAAETPIFAGDNHITDIPDHKNRMAAAEKMSKMHNLEKPSELNVTHKGKIEHTIDVTPIMDILNGISPE
jgi:phage terminase small subunit